MPEDLQKYGLIPEFIGRLPVVAAVSRLDQDALVRILTEPKNALVKQYQRMFQIDGVELEFDDDAVAAIADQALLRGTGARGLRAILEEVLQQVMFDVPSRDDVARVVITREVVLENVNPTLIPREVEQDEAHTPREERLTGPASRPRIASVSDLPTPIPAELARLRGSIDNIDAALVYLLAERFKATQQVGVLKATPRAAAVGPAREEQQVARLRELARTADLDPVFAEKFLAFIVEEVIRHHEAIAQGHAPGD